MGDAAELRVKFSSAGADAVQRDIKSTSGAVQAFNGVASKMGTAAGTALGVVTGAGITKLVGGLVSATGGALNFGAQMANVNSIMQLSDSGIAALSDQVLQLAQNPGITQSPAELAEGLYNISSSGFQGADGLNILNTAAIAATAGVTSTETAARAVTGTLNAYGLAADQAGNVSDILFQTVQDGVISFDELANNMGNTTPIAASLGIGMDQLGAAYAQMTLSNVNASAAETQISALMRSALNPTEALTSAVQAHGYASAESLIQTEGLSGYLEVLTDASGGSKEALFDLLGTQEAANAATILGKDGVEAYNAELDKMQHASDGAGATQKALEKQMKSASFQIAKAKQSMQILATTIMGALAPGIGFAASQFTRLITGGLLPFTSIIAKAFRGGFEFNELVKGLPQPLQRTAHAFGVVAEGIGDVVRGFGEGGLAGAIRTLTEGGELDQITGALSAIGEEAWNAVKAGFDAIPWGTIWDTAIAAIKGAAGETIDLVKVSVTSGIELLGDIGDAAGDLWGWVKNKLYGGGGPVDPAGTGGPEQSGADQNIPFGTVFVDGALALIGEIGDAAGDLWGWVQSKLFGGSDASGPFVPGTFGRQGSTAGIGGHSVPIGTVLLEGAVDLAGDLLKIHTGFQAWLTDKVGPLAADLLVDVNMKLDDKAADDAYKSGHDIGKSGMQKFIDGLTNGFGDGGGNGGGNGGGGGGLSAALQLPWKIKFMIDRFIGGVVVGIGEAAGIALKNAANPLKGVVDIPGKISEWFTDAMSSATFGANGSMDPAQGFSAGQSPFDELSTIISNSLIGEIADIAKKIPGYKDDLVEAVKGIVPDSLPDLDLPEFKINLDPVQGIVDSAINTIKGWTHDIREALADLLFWKNQGSENADITLGGDTGGLGGSPGQQRAGTLGPQEGSAPAAPLPLVKIDADTSLADGKINTLNDKVTTFTASPYTGILDFDNGPAAVKYTDTFNWGTVFDAATFTSTFDIDNGPAAVAYTDAFTWGDIWDGTTFTASFDVDTSGLYAALDVARFVASEIAALMPHSPAEKGPLKEPISFQYIADDMMRSMGGMPSYAERSMRLVRDAVTARNRLMATTGNGYGGGVQPSNRPTPSDRGSIGRQYNAPVFNGPVALHPASTNVNEAISSAAIRRGRG